MGAVFILLVAVVGLVVLRLSQASTNPAVVKLYGVDDLGLLQTNDGRMVGRDAGISGLVGGMPFWTFGDTLYNTSSIGRPVQPWEFRSMTGAYGQIANPTKLTDAVGSDGLPPQVVPFSPSELAYNKQKNQFDDRYALWPSGVIPIDQNSSYIFYSSILIGKGDLNYKLQYFGAAKLQKGQYVAERVGPELFRGRNIPISVEFLEGDTLYLSSCSVGAFLSAPCKVGKVKLANVLQENAYQWWDGKSWQADYAKAATVLDGSTTGMSIKYNPYLKKYISVYLPIFNNSLRLRTADKVEGPWSEAQEIYYTPDAKDSKNYAASMHPEYDPSGKSIYISYLDARFGNIRMLRADLTDSNSVVINLPSTSADYQLSQTSAGANSCNVQIGFKSNADYRGCIIEPSTPLNIYSSQFQRFSVEKKIKICATALNPTQKPLEVSLQDKNQTKKRLSLQFGNEGIGKILGCGVVENPGSFNSLQIVSSEKVIINKLVIGKQ